MGSFSIIHWIVLIVMIASPTMGIIRGVKNRSVANALISAFIPVYGIIYFFAANKSAARGFRRR